MEEKLLELIKVAIECEKVSKKVYVEVHYEGQNEIEICIRSKIAHDYISTAKITLNENYFTIDDLIEKIKKISKEEERCSKESKQI